MTDKPSVIDHKDLFSELRYVRGVMYKWSCTTCGRETPCMLITAHHHNMDIVDIEPNHCIYRTEPFESVKWEYDGPVRWCHD